MKLKLAYLAILACTTNFYMFLKIKKIINGGNEWEKKLEEKWNMICFTMQDKMLLNCLMTILELDLKLQSITKYLRVTLVLRYNRKSLISVF